MNENKIKFLVVSSFIYQVSLNILLSKRVVKLNNQSLKSFHSLPIKNSMFN